MIAATDHHHVAAARLAHRPRDPARHVGLALAIARARIIALAELAEVRGEALGEDVQRERLLEEVIPQRVRVLEAEAIAQEAHTVARAGLWRSE